ncbi:trypsin-2-like [Cimex lectularius]|uniref:Peptidase S1 domain-containing protein n=1 Tax=Cimex lectularius TaxID=79782 RepID=A0A8I6RLT0_CIMLE|nr:trypsin-2-like [Cimex lectularius]
MRIFLSILILQWMLELVSPFLNQQQYHKTGVKIIGGRKARYKEFPFAVVFIRRSNSQSVCMGSVVTVLKVLSAAHCFQQLKEGKMVKVDLKIIWAVAGSRYTHRLEYGYQKRAIISQEPHPEFQWLDYTIINDIAIAHLDSPFPISELIKPLTVYSSDPTVFKRKWDSLRKLHTLCYGIGFGSTTATGNSTYIITSSYLKVSLVLLLTYKDCSKIYPKLVEEFKKEKTYCAVSIHSNEGMCVGDSGSPLYCDGHIYAIFTKSDGCGEHSKPALYLSLESYITMYGLSGQTSVILNGSFHSTLLCLLEITRLLYIFEQLY